MGNRNDNKSSIKLTTAQYCGCQCCCAVAMLLTALVQPHWVTTPMFGMSSVCPSVLSALHPWVSAPECLSSARLYPLPGIRAAGASAGAGDWPEPGRAKRGPGPSQRLEAAGLRLRWKMSSQLDTTWVQGWWWGIGARPEWSGASSSGPPWSLSDLWRINDCRNDFDTGLYELMMGSFSWISVCCNTGVSRIRAWPRGAGAMDSAHERGGGGREGVGGGQEMRSHELRPPWAGLRPGPVTSPSEEWGVYCDSGVMSTARHMQHEQTQPCHGDRDQCHAEIGST